MQEAEEEEYKQWLRRKKSGCIYSRTVKSNQWWDRKWLGCATPLITSPMRFDFSAFSVSGKLFVPRLLCGCAAFTFFHADRSRIAAADQFPTTAAHTTGRKSPKAFTMSFDTIHDHSPPSKAHITPWRPWSLSQSLLKTVKCHKCQKYHKCHMVSYLP